jgi:hypothetical protein
VCSRIQGTHIILLKLVASLKVVVILKQLYLLIKLLGFLWRIYYLQQVVSIYGAWKNNLGMVGFTYNKQWLSVKYHQIARTFCEPEFDFFAIPAISWVGLLKSIDISHILFVSGVPGQLVAAVSRS